MLSIEEILTKEPYDSFEEIQEIKRYIEEKIFETGIVNKSFWHEKKHQYISSYTRHINRRIWRLDYFHIFVHEFMQKKINKQPYSLNSFKAGLEVIKESDVKSNTDNCVFIGNLGNYYTWLHNQTRQSLENEHQKHEEIPPEHCLLWALCNRLQRSNFDHKDVDSAFIEFRQKEETWIQECESYNKLFKMHFPNQLGFWSYKTFLLRKTRSFDESISGEVFLLLDGSNDRKAIIFEPISIGGQSILDLIFKMFFYAYLHNKKFSKTIGFKNKIEKFGFLDHDFYDDFNFGSVSNIFEHKLPKELTILFDELHKKIKEKSFFKTTNKEIVIAWWKKNFNTICSAVAAIGSIVGTIVVLFGR